MTIVFVVRPEAIDIENTKRKWLIAIAMSKSGAAKSAEMPTVKRSGKLIRDSKIVKPSICKLERFGSLVYLLRQLDCQCFLCFACAPFRPDFFGLQRIH